MQRFRLLTIGHATCRSLRIAPVLYLDNNKDKLVSNIISKRFFLKETLKIVNINSTIIFVLIYF
jgi:hypothetical protein